MNEYWGNSKRRLRLTQELKQLINGDSNPVQSQIDSIQNAIATQISGMEPDNPARKGLEFISQTLEAAQEDSELITELAKEAAKTASSVNRAYNSRKYDSPAKLKDKAADILSKVDLDEETADIAYRLRYAQAEMAGEELPPPEVSFDIKAEYINTCKAFVEALLPDFAEDIVYKFASAIVAKETYAPVANSLRYDIAGDLKEYDNLPIPDEFESNVDEVQPQKSSYKGKPLEPISQTELGFAPSSGNLAPTVSKLYELKIAVVMVVEVGAIVVIKTGQMVSAVVGAITSLATSIAAWMYLAAIAVIAVVVAYFVKKAIESMVSLTGQFIYMFAEADGIDISFAALDDKISKRTVNDAIIAAFSQFQSYSPYKYSECFTFIVDDEDSGKIENRILGDYWITAAYIVKTQGAIALVKLDESLWKTTFQALNAQVDEFYRFK